MGEDTYLSSGKVLSKTKKTCPRKKYSSLFFSDIDECSSRSLHHCGIGAKCINTQPGYKCECPAGYQGNGKTGCEPAEVKTGCGSDFDCTNNAECSSKGSCQCRPGFEAKGALCLDIDECTRYTTLYFSFFTAFRSCLFFPLDKSVSFAF